MQSEHTTREGLNSEPHILHLLEPQKNKSTASTKQTHQNTKMLLPQMDWLGKRHAVRQKTMKILVFPANSDVDIALLIHIHIH